MRFHIGFSKFISPFTLLKILGALFIGLLAFFGITQHQIVYAEGWQSLTFGTSDYSVAYTSSDGYSAGSSGVFLSGGPPDYLLGSNYLDVASTGVTVNQAKFTHYGSTLCSGQDDYLEMIFDFHVFDTSNNHVSYEFKLDTYGSQASCTYTPKTDSIVTVSCSKNIADISDSTFRILFTAISHSDTTYQEAHVGPYKIINYQCSNSTGAIINNNNSNTNNIINNNNNNTQNIIDNQTQNTQDIIDSNNNNTQSIIDSNKVCKNYTIDVNTTIQNGLINSSGNITTTPVWRVTDYLPISSNSTIKVIDDLSAGFNAYLCFYNSNKTTISCIENSTLISNSNISIPSNSKYVRFSIFPSSNRPSFDFSTCVNGSQAISDSLTDDNVSGASSTGQGFFDNFTLDDSRGFSNIVVAPIQFLRDILTSSGTCQPLSVDFNPSDGVHSGSANWSIPCGEILWSKAPNGVVLLWYTLIYGILGYRVLIDMVRFINRTINPEDTSEYVMDL